MGVVVDALDVNLFGEGTIIARRLTTEASASSAVYLINLDFVRPKIAVPLNLTLTFSKNHTPFDVSFNVDADEIDAGTQLGSILVSPRKP